MTGELASRVKKARTTGGVCPKCGTTLIQGQSIAKVNGRWLHTLCVTGRAPMIGPHSGQ
jgi:hypothetical protein